MRSATAFFAALAFTAVAFAQTPPPPAKRLPPAGLAIAEKDRAELTAGAAALRQEIDEVESDDKALSVKNGNWIPDLEVLHKAVDWALRYDEFFDQNQIAFAKEVLRQGHERVAQLHQGKTPWLEKPGLVIRGYRSDIDNSFQPYALVVPPDWTAGDKRPRRLDVVLSGRNEKRTELAFIAEHEKSAGDIVPAGAIVLFPYGRFCNATKFAGEIDVLDAKRAVGSNYTVDPTRIIVRGFSMGGASTWHLAVHYPSHWTAASPGAGFAETALYTKAFAPGKETPTWWEQKLWHWYNATDVAGNLFNVPTVAYSGEIDPQKQSADVMEQAMATEGLKLERLIGPKTGHKYEPETKAKLAARLDELAKKGRESVPREVHLTTYTMTYHSSDWVSIEGLARHWERADVRAHLEADGSVVAETKNVTAVRLTPGNKAPNGVVLDGQRLSGSDIFFWKDATSWHVGHRSSDGPRKKLGLNGPIDDAFMFTFVFVRPTGKPLNEKMGNWTNHELAHAIKMWRDIFRGDALVRDDTTIKDADNIPPGNLVLWGDPSSNSLLAKMLPLLPLQWDAEKIVFRGKTYDATHHAPIMIFPNPLRPAYYVVLNSGMDFRDDAYGTNALQIPKLPDYAIVDLDTAPGPKWPGKIVDAGFFDEEWK